MAVSPGCSSIQSGYSRIRGFLSRIVITGDSGSLSDLLQQFKVYDYLHGA